MYYCKKGCKAGKETENCCYICNEKDCEFSCESLPYSCGESKTDHHKEGQREFREKYSALIEQLVRHTEIKKQNEQIINDARDELMELMRDDPIKKYNDSIVSIKYCEEQKNMKVDNTLLKNEFPDVYEKCLVERTRKGYIEVRLF